MPLMTRPFDQLARVLLVVGLVSVVAGACGPMEGRLDAASLTLDPCRDGGPRTFEPFSLNFEIVGAKQSADQLFVQALSEGDRLTHTDVFVIVVDGYEAFAAWREANPDADYPLGLDTARLEPGVPVPAGAAGYPDLAAARATASLSLARRCPDATATLEAANGSIHFDRLATREGSDIQCSFAFDLIDRRQDCHDADGDGQADCVLAPNVSGELHFRIRGPRPYEDFPD